MNDMVEFMRMSEYHRGYVDGQQSMDAERQAVAARLRGLEFDGGSHASLVKLARAILPETELWTPKACGKLRDELIRLMGGAGYVPLVQYDVLGNERNKAVCELRGIHADSGGFVKALATAIGVEWQAPRVQQTLGEVRDRLIHLLGGDAPTPSDLDGIWQDGAKFETKAGESASKMTKIAEIGKLGVDGTSPNDDGTCPNDVPTPSITDELREWMRVVFTDDDPAYAIADRIDGEVAELRHDAEIWYDRAEDLRKERDDAERERDYWKQNCNAVLWLLGDVAIAWRNKTSETPSQVKHESGYEVKESEYREYDLTAPVIGVPTVFANIEYPKNNPPDVIEIAGTRYIREDARERD